MTGENNFIKQPDISNLSREQLIEIIQKMRAEAKGLTKCEGLNKRKERCGRNVKQGERYCTYHKNKKQEPLQTPEQVIKPIPLPRKRLAKPTPAPRETSAFPLKKTALPAILAHTLPGLEKGTFPIMPALVETAFRGWDKNISINIGNEEEDPSVILQNASKQMTDVINRELKEHNNIKVSTVMNVEFEKLDGENEYKLSQPYFQTKAVKIDKSTDVEFEVEVIRETLMMRIATYQKEGSNWVYKRTKSLKIGISKYSPLRGSS